jgi:putative FmdB family regulatory protein
MPLYEYICDDCDETFEVIRSVADTDEVTCPECGRPARKKLSWFATGTSSAGGCGTGGSRGRFGGG